MSNRNPSELEGIDEEEHYRKLIDAKEYLRELTDEELQHITPEQYLRLSRKQDAEDIARMKDMDKGAVHVWIPRSWKRCFGWEDGNGEKGPGYKVVEDDAWFGEDEERKRKQILLFEVIIPVYNYAKEKYPSESWIKAIDKSFKDLEALEIEKAKKADIEAVPVKIRIPKTWKHAFGWREGDGDEGTYYIVVEDDVWFREDREKRQALINELGLPVVPPVVGPSTKSGELEGKRPGSSIQPLDPPRRRLRKSMRLEAKRLRKSAEAPAARWMEGN